MSRTLLEDKAWRDYEEGYGPKPEIKAPLGRHTRKCTVCKHPEREAIELEFLRWRSPKDIADDYGFNDYSSIYRHARAAGLFEQRRATIRFALEPLIERAEHVAVTADALVRAVRAYCSINDSGQWIEPPAHVVYHSIPAARTLELAPPSSPALLSAPTEQPASGPRRQKSNRQLQELEGVPTRRKQSTATSSNRQSASVSPAATGLTSVPGANIVGRTGGGE